MAKAKRDFTQVAHDVFRRAIGEVPARRPRPPRSPQRRALAALAVRRAGRLGRSD